MRFRRFDRDSTVNSMQYVRQTGQVIANRNIGTTSKFLRERGNERCRRVDLFYRGNHLFKRKNKFPADGVMMMLFVPLRVEMLPP